MNDFNDLGLSEKALSAVARLGYEAPTPVQEQAIPLVLEGRDLIAAAKTGTGKTAAFTLPAMDTLDHAKGGQGPLMLVVTPTRELAQQIGDVAAAVAVSTHHRILTIVGGLSYEPQIKKLKHGVDVLIATPGRLIDLMEQQAVRLGDVGILVLDEADRMLDMGFWPSMKKIIAAVPAAHQTLLFSATIDRTIMGSVGKLLHDPALVEIAHKGDTADTVDQFIVHVPQTLKPELLKAVLTEKGADRVIVFARTRSRADSTCRRLKKAGFSAEAIHSDRSQAQRRRALDNFSAGKTKVLVATDVLARGIDVTEVDYVVNYDLPTQPEDYVHRIGRTGRAGETGWSLSFVSPETQDALRAIEKLTKREIPEMEIKSFDVDAAEAAVAARATHQTARRDPDVAQAARELAKRERKKKQAQGESEGESGASGIPGADKRSSGTKPAAKKLKPTRQRPAQEAQVKKAKPSRPAKPAGKQGTGTNRPSAKKQSAKKTTSVPKARKGGADLRPGRAHRAHVARQRGKQ